MHLTVCVQTIQPTPATGMKLSTCVSVDRGGSLL